MVMIHAIEWLSGIRCIKNKMKNKKYSQHESGIAVATWIFASVTSGNRLHSHCGAYTRAKVSRN